MATIVKNKPAAVTKLKEVKKSATTKEKIEARVDHCGALKAVADDKKTAYDQAMKKYNDAKAEVLALFDEEYEALDKDTFEGDAYNMSVGAKAQVQVEADNKAIFKALEKVEKGLAFQCMSFTSKVINEYLTGKQVAKMTKREAKGARVVKVTERK